MNIRFGIAWGALTIMALATAAYAAPSVERGKELFNGTQLGTNGKSCAGCHPGGRGLAEAADYGDEQLAGIINRCIAKPLRGRPLDAGSPDLKSLIMYLRTLSGPEGK